MTDADTKHYLIAVPGILFDEFIERSYAPIEESWPEPQVQKRGKGARYVYLCTAIQRDKILQHIADFCDMSNYFDADDRRGRAAGRLGFKWVQQVGAETGWVSKW